MLLGAKTIKDEIEAGNIRIDDFDETRLNPNSYNLRLGNSIRVYSNTPAVPYRDDDNVSNPYIRDIVLDMAKPNPTQEIIIPASGLMLKPGRIYLGRTIEKTFTDKYVPMIEGRSSVGRLGLFIHVTAGFGDIGFDGTWTLELVATQPIIIYPDVEICQIYFHDITNGDVQYTSEKYHGQIEPRESRLYMDFNK